jgi:hypothetical protein
MSRFKKKSFLNIVNEEMPYKVAADAEKALRSWGIVLPVAIQIRLSNGPNCHMCKCIKI